MANDRIWITRSEPSATRLGRELSRSGYECIVEPVIEIEPIDAQPPKTDFDLVVYLSSHAVRYCNPLKRGALATMAVGIRTAQTLQDSEIAALVPNVSTSEGLVEFIGAHYGNASTVLIISGTKSRAYLGATLEKLGMLVEKCEVYARRPRDINIPEIYQRSNVILIESLNCFQIVQDSLHSVGHVVQERKHVIVPTDRLAQVATQSPNFFVHVSNGITLDNILHVLSKLNLHVKS